MHPALKLIVAVAISVAVGMVAAALWCTTAGEVTAWLCMAGFAILSTKR